MSKTFVSRFITTNNSFVIARVTWDNNDSNLFSIKIQEGDNGWSGRFSKEFAAQFSSNVFETEEAYYNNVKSALEDAGDPYIYDFTILKEDSAKFTWKRKLENSSGTLVHGTVPVHKDENISRESFIYELINENRSLRSQVKETNDKNNQLTTELEKRKTELEQFVNLKNSLEKSLYGKFVTVLNSKKRRINLLETHLSKLSKSDGDEHENELD